MRSILIAASLLVVAPAWTHAALAQTPSVQITEAWARATAPHAMGGGAFLTLTAHGAPDALVGAASPVAKDVELHETINDQGVMKMVAVPVLNLAPEAPVTLRPGSYHIMLMGLTRQLKPGDTFPMTLTFQKAAPVTVTVTVGKAGAAGPMPGGPMQGSMGNMGGAPSKP
ncbi:MAG: hypothetical protein BGP12_17420 [Rhodospirillales bacterium 70-18]|nr:copper chaperone PCu(A)C [Rhodospirillales bacterium]OJY65641.1 MAG: hypothetical protein BGP12_17420 [Rhodospirillales bacterium 70-18]